MKTMPILVAMLLAGSAFAEPIFTPADADRIVNERVATLNSIKSDPRPLQPVDPNVQWAASPSKVDYSIVTLPNAETASVLTFK
jgi:hypothetical protein